MIPKHKDIVVEGYFEIYLSDNGICTANLQIDNYCFIQDKATQHFYKNILLKKE